MKEVKFLTRFIAPIRARTKTATTRRRPLGKEGDLLRVEGVTPELHLRLTLVERVNLEVVAVQYFLPEGCASPADFRRTWKEIHPRKPYDQLDIVYLHHFDLEGS